MPNNQITDKDLMTTLLSQHKFSAQTLTGLITECANEDLRRDCMSVLESTLNHQKQLWDAMTQKGWYQVQPASPQEISRVQNSINSMQQGNM
jgi:spore coat protein F